METLKRIQRLQEEVVESGLGAQFIVSEKPASALDASWHGVDDSLIGLFSKFVDEPEVEDVARDLFASGFYNLAVLEALKSLEKEIKKRSGCQKSGTSLMRAVFKKDNPMIKINDGLSVSDRDQREGYEHIFAGVMLGIRNPTAHEIDWVDDAKTALEIIIFAQHLLRLVKAPR